MRSFLSRLTVLVAYALILNFSTGYALRCFTCTSLELQSSCSNASNETTNAVVCDPYCPVCVTVTWNDSVKTITVRSCAAFTDVCEIYNTTYGSMDSCTTCDTDLCNGFP